MSDEEIKAIEELVKESTEPNGLLLQLLGIAMIILSVIVAILKLI